jgi:uncharacterized membrane protein YGL010W
MKTLKEQFDGYAAYHRHPRNKLSHFVGLPLVTFSLFLLLSWLRFYYAPELPISAAVLFFLVALIYYWRLDWSIALFQAPFSLALLALADRAALLPFGFSLIIFLAACVSGWVIQLSGHAIEGKRPALADHLLQVVNAPLILTVEALNFLGFRRDLIPADGAAQAITDLIPTPAETETQDHAHVPGATAP